MEEQTLEENLRWLCKQWQRRLRLQDWEIIVEVKRDKDFPEDSRGSYGFCRANWQHRTAHIVIRDPVFHDDEPFPFDPEQVLVHELMHCYFAGASIHDNADQDKYDLACLEFAIDSISQALVRAYR